MHAHFNMQSRSGAKQHGTRGSSVISQAQVQVKLSQNERERTLRGIPNDLRASARETVLLDNFVPGSDARDVDQTDGLSRRRSTRAGDAGSGNANIRADSPASAMGHSEGTLRAHGSDSAQNFLGNAEQ
jgi:hypothetical protein